MTRSPLTPGDVAALDQWEAGNRRATADILAQAIHQLDHKQQPAALMALDLLAAAREIDHESVATAFAWTLTILAEHVCETSTVDADASTVDHATATEHPTSDLASGPLGPILGAITDLGAIDVDDRRLRVLAGRLPDDTVPHAWIAVEHSGGTSELLALPILKLEALRRKLDAAARIGEQS